MINLYKKLRRLFYMDFTMKILSLYGLNPDDYDSDSVVVSDIDQGHLISLTQKSNKTCPYCGSTHCHIKDYDTVSYDFSNESNENIIIRIKKVRMICLDCKKSFTSKSKGIEEKSQTPTIILERVKHAFTEMYTFDQIAKKYHKSPSWVIDYFDKTCKFVPRRELPKYLAIDEIKFDEKEYGKYVVVLSNAENGELVDIIRNRQLDYLKDYFSKISSKERSKVKVFISDMYDGYATIKELFFKSATHIIDMFHIVSQLTAALNRIRVITMKNIIHEGTFGHNFIKSNWKLFLAREKDVPNKRYVPKDGDRTFSYSEMIAYCLNKSSSFLSAHTALQELYKYHQYSSYTEAAAFLDRIIDKLTASKDEILLKVAETYRKWRNEIIEAFSYKDENGKRLTNAVAEGNNNFLSTLIKISYGYGNFERLRKRALLIKTYNDKYKKRGGLAS